MINNPKDVKVIILGVHKIYTIFTVVLIIIEVCVGRGG